MSVSHTAYFFVEGDYKKGPGRSFAIPEHEPVMVIRDPPGGSSYASYKNIRTEFHLLDRTIENRNEGADKSYNSHVGFKVETNGCAGFLAAFLCMKAFQMDGDYENYKHTESTTNIFSGNKESTTYSTTWSYTTSSNTIRAGEESDVFVVPNLNVAYETVQLVRWSKDTCSPILDKNGDLLEDKVFKFDVSKLWRKLQLLQLSAKTNISL